MEFCERDRAAVWAWRVSAFSPSSELPNKLAKSSESLGSGVGEEFLEGEPSAGWEAGADVGGASRGGDAQVGVIVRTLEAVGWEILGESCGGELSAGWDARAGVDSAAEVCGAQAMIVGVIWALEYVGAGILALGHIDSSGKLSCGNSWGTELCGWSASQPGEAGGE